MSPRPVLTFRPTATDDRTVLRRLVAESVERAAGAHGRGVGGWVEDVRRLHEAVTNLSAARRAGAGEDVVAALRERVSVAMILVMPVHRSASEHVNEVLSAPGSADMLGLWRTLGMAGLGPVDPWLHRPLTDSVHDALAARISPLRLAPAA